MICESDVFWSFFRISFTYLDKERGLAIVLLVPGGEIFSKYFEIWFWNPRKKAKQVFFYILRLNKSKMTALMAPPMLCLIPDLSSKIIITIFMSDAWYLGDPRDDSSSFTPRPSVEPFWIGLEMEYCLFVIFILSFWFRLWWKSPEGFCCRSLLWKSQASLDGAPLINMILIIDS